MYQNIDDFLHALAFESPQSPERVAVVRTLLERIVTLAETNSDLDDLRVAVTALDELLEASAMFSHWRDSKKLAVFGSARTPENHPLFAMARELSAEMARRGWMTVSGAGPGIMAASAMGAGKAMTLGVNIALPFEQFANPYVDAETMLVAMQYFFTRKVAMTRPSNAFAIFPGGLGTMDEAFEVLTLLHTGKSSPAPVVLVDTPDGEFWQQWMTFVDTAIKGGHYIGDNDMVLVRICHTVNDAVREIEHFYSNYQRFEVDSSEAKMTLRHRPTQAQLQSLNESFPVFSREPGFRIIDDTSIAFPFDGRNYVSLRALIDTVNSWPN